MTFGETIKAVRTRKGISQEDLAKLYGTTQQNINKFEHDTCPPRQKTIIKMMKVLDAADDFLQFLPVDNPSEMSKTIQLCSKLSKKGLKKVNEYIRNNLLCDPKFCNSETDEESRSKSDDE